jgi:hypothetical protein
MIAPNLIDIPQVGEGILIVDAGGMTVVRP